jgi:ribonuclease D
MTAPGETPRIVAALDEIPAFLREVSRASRLGVDLEASGMFTYRARPCTLQLAWDAGASIAVVDTLAVPLASVGSLLGKDGPLKIVHDVAFDARLLAESGIELANVHDTAIAARMLGRSATGLASLLESLLGVRVAKDMQQHDWRKRPLDGAGLAYLASDVASLERLESALWSDVTARGIEQEVLEETEYRLASAIAAARAPQSGPAYLRMRGIDRLPERTLSVLRVIAELREKEAERRDVPPHRVMPSEALIAIARDRPATTDALARIRGVSTASPAARAFVAAIANAIATAGDVLPDDERAHFHRAPVPAGVHRARREREARLLAWRRAEATRRGVDEQVVLPGHCVKDAADRNARAMDDLARVPGIGAFRVERDGPAMLRALLGEGNGA